MRKLSIGRYLLTGLFVLLPLWLTVLAASWTFDALSTVSEPVVRPVLDRIADATGTDLDRLVVVVAAVLTLVVIYLVGWFGSRMVGARLHAGFDRLVARLPLIGVIYGGVSKLLDALRGTPDQAQRVVLIDSPRGGSGTAVGFVTRVLVDSTTGKEFAAVFVPTTPNPTSGSLELVPIEDVRPSDITVDEAMTFILSGGAVAPERFEGRVGG